MDVTAIKGIGAKYQENLNKLGINTVEQLLTYYPMRYDILKRSDLDLVNEEDRVIIDGKVESIPLVLRFNKGLNKMNFRLATSNTLLGVSIFNRAFLKKNLEIGTNVIVIGKYDRKKNIITASDIKFGILTTSEKIEPVYHLTSGITNKSLHTFINLGLLTYGKEVTDYIPDYLIEKYDYSNKKTCLNIIHNPSNIDKLEEIKNRLKYEELFVFMTKINYLKLINKKNNGLVRNIDLKVLDDIYKLLPFKLTVDQDKVIREIIDDLNSPKTMNRLLQGDVGSGKTIVSIIAMYVNKLSGYQSALMAPTEILATQHYLNIQKLLGKKVKVGLLIGSLSKKEKKEMYEKIENGEIDFIIGTHALIQEDVHYQNLGLVVTDEQHRFGVNQRANLRNKGLMPDVLYMSATPIPRTFALTIYGDMDVSTIKSMPVGRMPIETIVKSNEEITSVLELMYEELKQKHQIYVIAPLIEDNENTDLTSVNNLCDKMNLAFGSKYKVDLLHGKMVNALKDEIMDRFKKNETNILVSTTVIEVGVDVPNATMIVIFDANRFGLSTLHQLRGRVGRGNIPSKCILIGNQDADRLKILEKTTDGFKIAEEDFKLRGSGDLFGTKQSGDMNFKIANIKEDYDLLIQANQDAKEFVKLKDEKYVELRNNIVSSINDN